MAFALEKAEEGFADFVAAPFQFCGVAGHLGLVMVRGNNADIIAERVGWHQETGKAGGLSSMEEGPPWVFHKCGL